MHCRDKGFAGHGIQFTTEPQHPDCWCSTTTQFGGVAPPSRLVVLHHDPDWWCCTTIQIGGVAPPPRLVVLHHRIAKARPPREVLCAGQGRCNCCAWLLVVVVVAALDWFLNPHCKWSPQCYGGHGEAKAYVKIWFSINDWFQA